MRYKQWDLHNHFWMKRLHAMLHYGNQRNKTNIQIDCIDIISMADVSDPITSPQLQL